MRNPDVWLRYTPDYGAFYAEIMPSILRIGKCILRVSRGEWASYSPHESDYQSIQLLEGLLGIYGG